MSAYEKVLLRLPEGAGAFLPRSGFVQPVALADCLTRWREFTSRKAQSLCAVEELRFYFFLSRLSGNRKCAGSCVTGK